MGASDLQLATAFAIPGKLIAVSIHNAHVSQQVWPPLTQPAVQLFFCSQLALAPLQDASWVSQC